MSNIHEENRGLSRRDLFRITGGALVAAAGASVGRGASGQVTGSTPEGGVVPLRLPMCAMDHLDRQQYIHNLEIHSFLRGAGGASNDGVNPVLWVKGAQRVVVSGGVDITDPKKPAIIGKGTPSGSVAYMKSIKKWVSWRSSAPPITAPRPGYPRGWYHKELAQQVTDFKGLRGFTTYDVTDPTRPNVLGEFSTGPTSWGTQGGFWDGGKYAYFEGSVDDQLRMESSERPFSPGLVIYDLSDPANCKLVSHWWVPGQRLGEEAEYKKFWWAGDQSSWTGNHGGGVAPVRVEDGGKYCYTGFGRFGLYVLDVSDITKPRMVGRLDHPLEAMGGIPYHSIYPVIADAAHPQLRDVYVSTIESLESDCREPWHAPYVMDIRDPRNPKVVGLFPRPMPDPKAPYPDYCCARGRFTTHNVASWGAPGIQKPNFIAFTYFNAGLQIFDITDPTAPKRIAYFIPPRAGDIEKWDTWRRSDVQVFVEWDRNLIWCGTTPYSGDQGGLYCLSCPALGKPILEPRKVERWTVPQLNAGWDDQTPRSAYFGRRLSQMG